MNRVITLTLKLSIILLHGLATLNAQIPNFKVSPNLSAISSNTSKQTLKNGNQQIYTTPEIILFNYLGLEKIEAEKNLEDLKAELLENSQGKTTPRLSKDTVEAKLVKIESLIKAIDMMDFQQDSLYYLYTKDYVNFDRFLTLQFGPKRARAFFDILYDNEGKIVKVLNNTGFNFGSNSAALYSELVSGSLGVFRVSLGTMVVSSSEDDPVEEKEEEAYQRLATYGGNTVLNLEYPLIYWHSRNKQFNFLSRFLAKGNADFPQFGTSTDKVAGSASYGIDFYGDASTSNNALRFFFNINLHRFKGTSIFRDNLGVSNSAFNYGQIVVGLVFAEKFKLSFIVHTLSSEEKLRDATLVGGGQVLHE